MTNSKMIFEMQIVCATNCRVLQLILNNLIMELSYTLNFHFTVCSCEIALFSVICRSRFPAILTKSPPKTMLKRNPANQTPTIPTRMSATMRRTSRAIRTTPTMILRRPMRIIRVDRRNASSSMSTVTSTSDIHSSPSKSASMRS